MYYNQSYSYLNNNITHFFSSGKMNDTVNMFQQLMLKFVSMEHDVQNLKDSVEEVKQMVTKCRGC